MKELKFLYICFKNKEVKMNIHDFPEIFDETNSKESLHFIFKRQKELMLKYRKIENENGFYYPESLEVDIDSMQGQTLLKNMAWRFIEEIGESIEALDDFNHREHFKEESIDALHFLTELLILSGISYEYFGEYFKTREVIMKNNDDVDYDSSLRLLIKNLGVAMNCLKMKPWAKSHNITDKEKYQKKLRLVYFTFIDFLYIFMTSEEILNYYFKKSEVNKFRQTSNY
jgi:hypothetical protein